MNDKSELLIEIAGVELIRFNQEVVDAYEGEPVTRTRAFDDLEVTITADGTDQSGKVHTDVQIRKI